MSETSTAPLATPDPPPSIDPEVVWLRDVFRPNEANLTVRAVVVGMLIALASLFSLVPTGLEVDSGWLFVVPVAYSLFARRTAVPGELDRQVDAIESLPAAEAFVGR